MSKIKTLDELTINQVAAGEVIERPAAVVKELVENSIDAGATLIEVHTEKGGSNLIRIVDNGEGMNSIDAKMCFERNATSKLSNIKDLDDIKTLGFRGEGVPSIASVSRFKLKTKQHFDEVGTEIDGAQGIIHEITECGMKDGTIFEVKNLFFNIPARQKFLKSNTTEDSKIEELVREFAIAHPNIGWTLIRDNKLIYRTPAQSADKRIYEFFGTRDIVYHEKQYENFSIKGWIGKPVLKCKDRKMQMFFINNRAVDGKAFYHGATKGFSQFFPDNVHGAMFLWIETEHGVVDVNIHPTKRDVKFRKDIDISGTLAAFIREAISPKITIREESFNQNTITVEIKEQLILDNFENLKEYKPDITGFSFKCEIDKIWLYERDGDILFLNPRLAKEQIIYENLTFERQQAIIPKTISLNSDNSDKLRKNREFLLKHGFLIEDFGPNEFIAAEVPANFDESLLEESIIELINEQVSKWGGIIANRLAKVPHISEATNLLNELSKCNSIKKSQHGGIMWMLGKNEINRRLGFS